MTDEEFKDPYLNKWLTSNHWILLFHHYQLELLMHLSNFIQSVAY